MNQIIPANKNLEFPPNNPVTKHCYEGYSDLKKERNITICNGLSQKSGKNENTEVQSPICESWISTRESIRERITLKSHRICCTFRQPVFYVDPNAESSLSTSSIISSDKNNSSAGGLSLSNHNGIKKSISVCDNLQQSRSVYQELAVNMATNTNRTEMTPNSPKMLEQPDNIASKNRCRCSDNKRCGCCSKAKEEKEKEPEPIPIQESLSTIESVSSKPYVSARECHCHCDIPKDIKIVNKVYGRQNNNYYHKFINKNLGSESTNCNCDQSKKVCYKFDCFGCQKKKMKDSNALTKKGTGSYYPCECDQPKKKKKCKNTGKMSVDTRERESYGGTESGYDGNCRCGSNRYEDNDTYASTTTEETITKVHKLDTPKRDSKKIPEDDVHCHCSRNKSGTRYLTDDKKLEKSKRNNNVEVYNCQVLNSLSDRNNIFKHSKQISDDYFIRTHDIGDGNSCTAKKKTITDIPLKSVPIESNYLTYGSSYYSKIQRTSNTLKRRYFMIRCKDTKQTNRIFSNNNTNSKITTVNDKVPLIPQEEGFDFEDIKPPMKFKRKFIKNCHTIVTKPMLQIKNSDHCKTMHGNESVALLNKANEANLGKIYDLPENNICSIPNEHRQVNCSSILDKEDDCGDFLNNNCAEVRSLKEQTKCQQLTVVYDRKINSSDSPVSESSHEQQVINPCGNIIFLVVEQPNCKMGCCYRVYRQCTTHGTTIPANRYTSTFNHELPPDPIYPISNGSHNFSCLLVRESKESGFSTNDKWPEVFFITKEVRNNPEVCQSPSFKIVSDSYQDIKKVVENECCQKFNL